MVLSLLFLASGGNTPAQHEASAFLQWLATAVDQETQATGSNSGRAEPNGEAESEAAGEDEVGDEYENDAESLGAETEAMAGAGGGDKDANASGSGMGPEAFEFASLPYRGAKDIAGSSVHMVLTYQGSFTQPPCIPIVQWFVAAEPFVAHSEDVMRLVNRSSSAHEGGGDPCGGLPCDFQGLGLGQGIWWDGPIDGTPKVAQPLPQRELHSMALSKHGFRQPMALLSSTTVSALPWWDIHFYSAVFLFCSVLMLCTTCGLCAQRFCSQ